MPTVVLLRHGRSTANTAHVLAGRSRGVHLDDTGREQAERAAERLSGTRLARIVTSPLERCRETARPLRRLHPDVRLSSDRGLVEVDYGGWTGRALKDLAKEKLWRVVQTQPSAATFPDGESLGAMSARVVSAVRRIDAAMDAEHGPSAVWVAVSHGDPIKAILADALGMHLDAFQRIHVEPGSISVVRYTPERPFVLMSNTTAGDLSGLTTPARKGARRSRATSDAVVGGGA